jgi:hypothetical protein
MRGVPAFGAPFPEHLGSAPQPPLCAAARQGPAGDAALFFSGRLRQKKQQSAGKARG